MIQDVPFNSYEVFKIQANCPKSIHGTKAVRMGLMSNRIMT